MVRLHDWPKLVFYFIRREVCMREMGVSDEFVWAREFALGLYSRGLLTGEQAEDVASDLRKALQEHGLVKVVAFDPIIITNVDDAIVYKAKEGHVFYVINPDLPLPEQVESEPLIDVRYDRERGHFYDLAFNERIDPTMSTITGDEGLRPEHTSEAHTPPPPPTTQIPSYDEGVTLEPTGYGRPGPAYKDAKVWLAALFGLLAFSLALFTSAFPAYGPTVHTFIVLGFVALAAVVVSVVIVARSRAEVAYIKSASAVLPARVTAAEAGTSYSGDAALRYAFYAGQKEVYAREVYARQDKSASEAKQQGQPRPLAIFDGGFAQDRPSDAASVDPPPRMMSDLQIARGFERVNEQVAGLQATLETLTGSKSIWANRGDVEAMARQLEQIETHIGRLPEHIMTVVDDKLKNFKG